jgi:two-component system sensor histidine kinase FlrB
MLPSSHAFPINVLGGDQIPSPQLLADAFSEFISASTVLEGSYRDLQHEVERLSSELAKRNVELTGSLAENDRMRATLQQMLDSLPCGVLVLSSDQRIVMINPEGRNLLELGNASVANLRELSRLSRLNFGALMQEADTQSDSELCMDTSNGKCWLAIGIRKLVNAATDQAAPDKSVRLESIWILRDITAKKEAELEREAARRTAALAEISTILAHEIRNPLASLELFAGLIEKDRGDSSEWISHLQAGIRTLSGTVNNVLSLNGEVKAHLLPLQLAACVKSGVDFVRPIAEQAGIQIDFSAKDGGLWTLGNEDAIRQIILNLAINAIRHTTAGGRIKVSIEAVDAAAMTRARVDVADNGSGIPESALAHIFDAGFSTAGQTPGLGLAVCKRLMTHHGGEIKVKSRVAHGTTVQLEFPTL